MDPNIIRVAELEKERNEWRTRALEAEESDVLSERRRREAEQARDKATESATKALKSATYWSDETLKFKQRVAELEAENKLLRSATNAAELGKAVQSLLDLCAPGDALRETRDKVSELSEALEVERARADAALDRAEKAEAKLSEARVPELESALLEAGDRARKAEATAKVQRERADRLEAAIPEVEQTLRTLAARLGRLSP